MARELGQHEACVRLVGQHGAWMDPLPALLCHLEHFLWAAIRAVFRPHYPNHPTDRALAGPFVSHRNAGDKMRRNLCLIGGSKVPKRLGSPRRAPRSCLSTPRT